MYLSTSNPFVAPAAAHISPVSGLGIVAGMAAVNDAPTARVRDAKGAEQAAPPRGEPR